MSFYRWCMRCGAAILFSLAFLQLVIGLIGFAQMVVSNGSSLGDSTYSPAQADPPFHFLLMLQALTGMLGSVAWPFFGALVINRLDRWLGSKQDAEPFE